MYEILLLKKDVKVGKIYLYDVIGYDDCSAQSVANAFSELEKEDVERFEVHLNSPGGSLFDGLAIYNLLKERNCHVVIDGIAASAASLIAMSGKTIRIHQNAFIMIHNAATFAAGEEKDLKKQAELLGRFTNTARQAYIDRTGKDDKTIRAWMDDETWFDAKQSLENNFVNEIIPQDSVVNTASAIANFQLQYNKGAVMDLRILLITLFALNEKVTNQEIEVYLKELKTKADNADGLQDQVDELTNQLETLTDPGNSAAEDPLADKVTALENIIKLQGETIANLQTAVVEQEAEKLVDSAVNQGKIFPNQKETYIKEAVADVATFANKLAGMPVLFNPEKGLGLPGDDPAPVSEFETFKAAMRAKTNK